MKRCIAILLIILNIAFAGLAQRVTIKAANQPAATVFRTIMEQTGKNFVYSSDLLDGVQVSVNANRRPLKKVLKDIFKDTDIEYSIKGNDVILKRHTVRRDKIPSSSNIIWTEKAIPVEEATLLDELIVESRLSRV